MTTGTDLDRLDVLRARVAELEKRLRQILDARADADRSQSSRKDGEEGEFARRSGKLAAEHAARRDELATRRSKALRGVEEHLARNLARADRGQQAVVNRAQAALNKEMDRLAAEQQRARDRSLGTIQESESLRTRKLSAVRAGIVEQRRGAQEWQSQLALFSRRVRVSLREPAPAPGHFDSQTTEQIADAVRAGIDEDRELLESREGEFWLKLVRGLSYPLVFGILVLLHGGAFAGAWFKRPDLVEKATFILPLSFAGSLVIGLSIVLLMRSAARSFVLALRGRAGEMESALKLHEEEVGRRIDAGRSRGLEDKIGVVADLDEKFLASIAEAKAVAAGKTDGVEKRHARLREKIERGRPRRIEAVRARFDAEEKALLESTRREAEELQSRRASSLAEGESLRTAAGGKLAADWEQAIDEFTRMSEEAGLQCRARFPEWGAASWKDFKMAREFPRSVYLGDVHLDFTAIAGSRKTGGAFSLPENGSLTLPLSLGFPEQGNLLVSTEAANRAQGIDALLSAVLRILTSLPPAKAKFLFIDPLGLGQSFSALMHLADHDESLVGGRIWTDTAHIEKKLADLTEHIEKVIQKYLRNRYSSIDQYNREAGQLAEAYRFLVIADFPAGFSELALDRLASIMTSGEKCGVYTLILHDRKQKLPAAFDPPRFRKTGLALKAAEGGFTLEEEALPQAQLQFEALPKPEALISILTAVGQQCVSAARVEVPFESVAPPDGQWGSLTSEKCIRVPVGRAGADRLQYLDIGHGTAQHALLAGKTGSGKSTLFHVMITNAALWYAPSELELYLIDFKKGVEFKRFATHRLPHARVVAIESDREFGLSVLRRIDRELTSRADLFRAAGVQDFGGYRRSGKGSLPRTLLLIDEFQEFFTDEDAVAQEASLLMDRIVRQGRAFGVHVILGSQTLGGSYTLAKTTLGQMGIRIALQCNEADSLLILGDDNAAARLLSRPGEAIYNDMSGMVEGNNPFQIVWLSDSTEEQYLAKLRHLADERSWAPREPTTVFEGNVPADIRNNDLLRKKLARPFVAEDDRGARAWIGEANAIKGPTEARFRRQGGSNLLIVGQQRESAISLVTSSLISLASAHAPKEVRFILLDGSPPEVSDSERFADLAAALPHGLERIEYARVPELVEELDAEIKSRLEGDAAARPPIYLVVYDLQRFRKLRQGDEFEMSSEEGGKLPPDKCMVNILTEGPARGIHTIVWADSLNNLKRTFTQKTLREFEMRVLFQMSASDSSELIDTPMASRLGLYRGLLFVEEEGTVEKFRPYALPDAETLSRIRKSLESGASELRA
ncbi:MAG: hypothetical protein K8T20_02210 [Planctomycetes bacterium]|nr:hypothetical protein [Planctomycetota bacterium]